MPTFPSTPVPNEIHAPSINLGVDRFRTSQGVEVRRAAYSSPWYTIRLVWLGIDSDELHRLMGFVETTVRGGLLSFDWTHPYPHAIDAVGDETPIWVRTTHIHGFANHHQVIIAGVDASVDGTYNLETRLPIGQARSFNLVGTTAQGAFGPGGTAAIHHPKLVLDLPGDVWPEPEKLLGPERNADGLWNCSLPLREESV